jgi:hypothetical protein
MWLETLQEIQRIQQEAKANGDPVWFRGQRDAKWVLLSSIHRSANKSYEAVLDGLSQAGPKTQGSEAQEIKLMRDSYKLLFHKFSARAIQLLPEYEKTEWGLVFAMQHLGLPTRFLDWTESFLCALYFAQLERKPSDDAAIFIFFPERHNERIMGKKGVVWLRGNIDNLASYHPAVVSQEDDMETLAVEPGLINARMVAQRSVFTLCGASFEPLEQKYPHHIKKIVLPSAEFNDVQAFLDLTGQTHFGYFPDLEGLREHIKEGIRQEIILAKEYRARHPH